MIIKTLKRMAMFTRAGRDIISVRIRRRIPLAARITRRTRKTRKTRTTRSNVGENKRSTRLSRM